MNNRYFEPCAAYTATGLTLRCPDKPKRLSRVSKLVHENMFHERVRDPIVKYGYVGRMLRYARRLISTPRKRNMEQLIGVALVEGTDIEVRSCVDEELSLFYRSPLKSEAQHFKEWSDAGEAACRRTDQSLRDMLCRNQTRWNQTSEQRAPFPQPVSCGGGGSRVRRLLSAMLVLAGLVAEGTSLRIEGNRASLEARNAPLAKVLERFEHRGIEVLLDPVLEEELVTGTWSHIPLVRLIEQLAHPHDYVLSWERINSPVGAIDRLARISVFVDEHPDKAEPSARKQRVLDVVKGKNGIEYIRSEILVGFADGATMKELEALLAQLGGTVLEVITFPGIYRIRIDDGMSVEEALAKALLSPGVQAAEPNLAISHYDARPLFLPPYGTAQGVNLNLQPGERAVAVLDSGLDPTYANHPLIRAMYNALDPDEPMSDPTGHGTLTSLIASGALTPLGGERGQTGLPVVPIKTFDSNGYTSSDSIMRAIVFAVESGVSYINMSWGSEVSSPFMEAAIEHAAREGLKPFAAAGNEPTGKPIYPAGYPMVVAVGGLAPNGEPWDQSNFGDFVDMEAPAIVIFNGRTYAGTSISAPYAIFLTEQNSLPSSIPLQLK